MSTLALPTNTAQRQLGLALPLPPSASPSMSTPALPSSTIVAPPRRQSLAIPGVPGPSQRSPSVELKDLDGDDEDGDEDDDDEGGKKKKGGAKGGKKGPAEPPKPGEYRYSNEISQMDPLPETVKLVEDVVRGQVIEMVTRARLLTHLRSSRFLSSEDIVFLIRDDRGKVNRLRTYLSWKDVRKKAKEDQEGDLDVEDADKAVHKARKQMVKLPWEKLTPFGDFLRSLPSSHGRSGLDDEDEEDEDEMQAYEDSMQRLKDADEITKKMTRDEYVHYSDCRQASFTYRKARKFRDFINFPAYLDIKPNDEIVDILGFLSFEMVRSLCITALSVRERMEQHALPPPARKSTIRPGSPVKRKREIADSPQKRFKADGGGGAVVTSPEPVTPAHTGPAGAGSTADPSTGRKHTSLAPPQGISLFAAPPSARQPLLPAHVLEAFAQIQREQAASKTRGMGNFRGVGFGRGKIALV